MFRKAILIIHGFGGGVYDEEYLSTELLMGMTCLLLLCQDMIQCLENIPGQTGLGVALST